MKPRKWILVLLALVISAVGVSAVGAQDVQRGEGRRGGRGAVLRSIVEIVTQETGLTAREVASAVADGSTVAEVITANGGDVQ
ncbi:MAG: hypothetical protein JNJ61_06695, partial [Anaerolineae bacterium]|nr:hypothetical protein [Anaerolineae bacterium]